MKLEHKIFLNRIQAPDELSEAERLQLQSQPELSSALAQNRILHTLGQSDLEPPARADLLARAYEQAATKQETHMSFIQRLFAGKPLAVRLALATLMLLAIAALSLLLPRAVLTPRGMEMHGMQPAFAATDGYMLLYEFKDYDAATIQPLVEQLTAAVREFKKAHNLPEANPQPGSNDISIGAEALEKCIIKQGTEPPADGSAEEVKKAAAIIAVQLTDASLLDELKAELAKIPGLPEPQVTDATWFYEKGLPLPGDDAINLKFGMGDKQHAFNFPKDATEPEIEAAINEWLQQNHPDMKFDVEVKKTTDDGKTRMEILVKSSPDGEMSAQAMDSTLSTSSRDTAGKAMASSGIDDHNIQLTINTGNGPHTFTFSLDASEEAMEQEISTWFAQSENQPDMKVDVQKTKTDGKTQIRVMLSDKDTANTSGGSQLQMEQGQTDSGETQLALSMNGQEHTFTFSSTATEQEISEQISSWLKQNMPEKDYNVTVSKSVKDGKTQLLFQIKCLETTEDK